MKKFFFVLITLILGNGAMAQTAQPCSTCLPEGITFTTQAQIDSFQANYPNCTQIEGNVTVCGEDIINLNGLNVLTSIWGADSIVGNSALPNLTGLDNLTSIGDDLIIGGNVDLTSLAGLDKLTSIGGTLEIRANSSLSTCGEQWLCNYLANPTGPVTIYGNAEGCKSVIDVALACGDVPCLPYGNYYFISKADIENFPTAFPFCTELKGNVIISGSDINDLDGLSAVTSIGGHLAFGSNSTLASLSGLENLSAIGGNFIFWNNQAITSLAGLESLKSTGDLALQYNNSMTSLTGLEGLNSIGDSLVIQGNNALTSLAGLDNVEANTISDVYIWENPSLSTCKAQSICDYLVAPNGTVEIHDNAQGCNSQEEVKTACQEGVDESSVVSHQSSVNIYPNPSSTNITIELPTSTPKKNTFMTIYYFNGQALISRHITEPIINEDVSGLSQGIYFVKVVSDDNVMMGKFVKE